MKTKTALLLSLYLVGALGFAVGMGGHYVLSQTVLKCECKQQSQPSCEQLAERFRAQVYEANQRIQATCGFEDNACWDRASEPYAQTLQTMIERGCEQPKTW